MRIKHFYLLASILCWVLAITGCQPPQNTANEQPTTPSTPEPSPPTDDNQQPRSEPILEYLITNKEQLTLCENIPFDVALARKNPQVYSLGAETSLVTVVCGMVNGQFVHEHYRYDASTATPTVIPLMVAVMTLDPQGKVTKNTARSVEGYAEYDVTEKILKITTMFDQMGECGTVGFYQLKDKTFEGQKLLAKPDCTTGYLDPKDYPQVYP